MLATGPNSWFGSWSSSNPELDRCDGFYHTKTRTIGIGPVLPPITQHFNLTSFTPIKYLSSDRIVTWSIHRLCIDNRSFASQFQNCDATNSHCVAIENPQISHQISRYFTVTQRILVASQFWIREVKELLELHNLRTDHDMIRSEHKNLIVAKEWPKL